MAASALVESEIELGKEVFLALRDDAILKPRGAMWFFDEDAREWRLIIVTEDARTRGPRAAYLRVRNVLRKASLLERVPLMRIVVATPDHPLLANVGRVIRTEGKGPHGIAMYENTFNQFYVPWIYIYHLQI